MDALLGVVDAIGDVDSRCLSVRGCAAVESDSACNERKKIISLLQAQHCFLSKATTKIQAVQAFYSYFSMAQWQTGRPFTGRLRVRVVRGSKIHEGYASSRPCVAWSAFCCIDRMALFCSRERPSAKFASNRKSSPFICAHDDFTPFPGVARSGVSPSNIPLFRSPRIRKIRGGGERMREAEGKRARFVAQRKQGQRTRKRITREVPGAGEGRGSSSAP